jgi:hypothetical protein
LTKINNLLYSSYYMSYDPTSEVHKNIRRAMFPDGIPDRTVEPEPEPEPEPVRDYLAKIADRGKDFFGSMATQTTVESPDLLEKDIAHAPLTADEVQNAKVHIAEAMQTYRREGRNILQETVFTESPNAIIEGLGGVKRLTGAVHDQLEETKPRSLFETISDWLGRQPLDGVAPAAPEDVKLAASLLLLPISGAYEDMTRGVRRIYTEQVPAAQKLRDGMSSMSLFASTAGNEQQRIATSRAVVNPVVAEAKANVAEIEPVLGEATTGAKDATGMMQVFENPAMLNAAPDVADVMQRLYDDIHTLGIPGSNKSIANVQESLRTVEAIIEEIRQTNTDTDQLTMELQGRADAAKSRIALLARYLGEDPQSVQVKEYNI